MTVIVTRNLIMRRMLATDDIIRQQVKWLNDPDVVRYSEQRHKRHNMETQRSYLGHFLHGHDQYREIYHGSTLIGSITANIDEPNSIANVGILIGDKSKWGQGFGTEAWKAFCDHLLIHGVRKLEAGTMATNFGMISIFRKTGMRIEGTRYCHFLVGNKLIDEVQWARFP